jgi:hypothetical protein
MPKKKDKKDDPDILWVPKNATKKQIYAIIKKNFSAADLQKYTVDEPMVPIEPVVAELEAMHARAVAKRKKK